MNNPKLKQQVDNRRTSAIIPHPDAGKTMIAEQLLLFDGAIRQAGTVKSKKTDNFVKSDWTEIEKQCGIFVISSVVQLDYQGRRVNILDTSGHEDFSEDTHHTLMAVDSVVMVIDSVEGIEAQIEKLFQVVKKRGIPISTFINKLDRDGREPLELLEELEESLDTESYLMDWSTGMGKELESLYDIYHNRVEFYRPENYQDERLVELDGDGLPPENHPLTENPLYEQVLEEVELIKEAGDAFNQGKIARGDQTPVFFGSVSANLGVQTFLETPVELALAPYGYKTQDDRMVSSYKEGPSGFVFKIQANMNPAHHDRIAFIRICSGTFKRGMDVWLERTNKKLKLSNVTQFMADSGENVEKAVAGDTIGVYDTGNYQIGDTLFEGKLRVAYEELPSFTPELFMKVTVKNVMKQKFFHRGIYQLVQEGVIQLYKTYLTEEYIIGAVGQLQFEVFQYRMLDEYNAEVIMPPVGHKIARWIDPEDLDERMSPSRNVLAHDRFDQPSFLFENQFAERWFVDKYLNVKLKSLM